jgi:5-methylcytosine-specific restriction endonuclease McrA
MSAAPIKLLGDGSELAAIMRRKAAVDPERIAGFMSGAIETRTARPRTQLLDSVQANGAFSGNSSGLDSCPNRGGGRFVRRRPQRSPDREKSIQRRRQFASTWPMPPVMAGRLTESQRAYARLIADEIAVRGVCDKTLDELAARGGMCRKTAKRAQQRLLELQWITVELRPVDGQKHKPNVIRIVSPEWKTWIEMGPRPRPIGGHSRPATENKFILKNLSKPLARYGAFGGALRERLAAHQPTRSLAEGALKRKSMAKLSRLKPIISKLPPRLPRAHADGTENARQRDIDAPWRKWYRTARWQQLRKHVLIRDGFTCQMCGRLEGDTSRLVCDHKQPHRGSETLFWDENNLQTLCKQPCHDKVKQGAESSTLMQRGVWD